MHGTARHHSATHVARTGVNAAIWIEPGRALLVRGGDGAEMAAQELVIPWQLSAMPPVLAEVAHSIGDVDRVLLLGVDDLRFALEREIVAIGHRPETIRETEIDGPVDAAALIARLANLR